MKRSGQAKEPVKRDKRGQCHYTFYKNRSNLCFLLLTSSVSHPISSYSFCTETSLIVPMAILQSLIVFFLIHVSLVECSCPKLHRHILILGEQKQYKLFLETFCLRYI